MSEILPVAPTQRDLDMGAACYGPLPMMSHAEIMRRYPRLIRAMRNAACLTTSEAVTAIQMHSLGDNYAGEAVNHFGGVRAVLTSAWRCRVMVRA